MKCPKCEASMDPSPSTEQFPNCNTWTCPNCQNVEPEILSGKLDPLPEVEGKSVSKTELPDEVRRHIEWYLGSYGLRQNPKPIDPDCVRWFAKSAISRGAAWDRVPMPKEGNYNPWRKVHTANYWAWIK